MKKLNNCMKKTIIIVCIATAITIAFTITACTKASEDVLAAKSNVTCDTTNVSYSADVVPILQGNCYSCHSTATNAGSGGIIFDSYSGLQHWAANGYLIGNITHAPGYVPMPYGGGKLSDCEISKIQAWIDQGTKNN
jgi:uncharacterized membrane protein